jgi:hypothetical protein
MQAAIVCLNLVVSLVTASGGVLALFRPTALLGATAANPGNSFYGHLYAARAIPVALRPRFCLFCCEGRE